MSVLCTVVTVLRCTAGWALQVSVGSGHSSGSHVLCWALEIGKFVNCELEE